MSEHFGYSTPIIDVKTANGTLTERLSFPLCNVEGLPTNIQEEVLNYKLIDGKLKQFVVGYRYEFTLHYNELITKDTLKLIFKILNYRAYPKRGLTEQELWLTPYSDNPSNRYKVLFTGEISFKSESDIDESSGFEMPVLKFTTVDLVDEIIMHDPDYTIYYARFSVLPITVSI